MDGGNQTEVGPTVDMVEGDSPSPSYQGFSPTCASHASAKAIVQLMDDKGYDVDQGQVTTILKSKVKSPVNTTAFDDMKIRVNARNKATGVDGEMTVEMSVKVVNLEDVKMQADQAFVVRWEFVNPWTGADCVHAIYAEKYDATTGMFYCVNSWGLIKGRPKIHQSAVTRIYLITLKLD